jgi:hypothetical protein
MRGRITRTVLLLAFAAALVLAASAVSVSAASPDLHYHYSFTCVSTPSAPADPKDCIGPDPNGIPTGVEIEPELCDIPGTKVDTESGNVTVFGDGTVKIEGTETYTFTSALTGKSIESRSHSQLTHNSVPIVSTDGKTVSLVFAFTGLEQQLKLPNGPVLAHDSGPITFTLTLDATTGDFVSFTVLQKSPHRLSDIGFCNVVIPAIS